MKSSKHSAPAQKRETPTFGSGSVSGILKIRSADFHDLRGKRGFSCGKCGYNAHELAALSHCPLCLICDGCNKTVRKCRCKEGE